MPAPTRNNTLPPPADDYYEGAVEGFTEQEIAELRRRAIEEVRLESEEANSVRAREHEVEDLCHEIQRLTNEVRREKAEKATMSDLIDTLQGAVTRGDNVISVQRQYIDCAQDVISSQKHDISNLASHLEHIQAHFRPFIQRRKSI
jgi:chromosome segregation ATPase